MVKNPPSKAGDKSSSLVRELRSHMLGQLISPLCQTMLLNEDGECCNEDPKQSNK